MERLSPLDELLVIAGKSVEVTGRTLRDKKSLSIDELQQLKDNLTAVVEVLDRKIHSLKEG